jgi:hypothetical protein
MTTVSVPSLSRSTIARMPFFWWREQAWPKQARPGADRLPTDDAYIPSGTADLWRSARPSHR